MPNIRVRGLERTIEAEAGTDLLKTCRDNHVNLFWGPWAKVLNCRGKGFCNLCTVEVLEGEDNLSPRTKRETKRLKGRPEHWRLGCCAKVQGDLYIDTFPVRHAADHASPEAIRRATLPEDERTALEEEDWAALKEDETPKERAPKKGLLAKIRKQKGIDDADQDPEAGEALLEEEAAGDAKPKKGLLGRVGKKGDGPKKGSPGKKTGTKGNGGAPADDGLEIEADPETSDAPEGPEAESAAETRSAKKKFGLKR